MSDQMVAKVVALNLATNGDNTVIAAPTAGDIKVWQMSFTAAGAVNIVFKNGSSTSQSGPYVLTGNGSSITFQYTGMPWSWADPGNAWIINLSTTQTVTGQIFYTSGS